MKMDRQMQGREMRKLMAPDYMLGSVHGCDPSIPDSLRKRRF